MKLDDGEDRVHIRFEPRTIDDILDVDDGREDEQLFASVARLSEFATEVYDMTVRPWLRAAITPEAAKAFREQQPIRTRSVAFSDQNPVMPPIGAMAEQVRASRKPVNGDNPFAAMERIGAQMIETQLNLYRDVRDAWFETVFHAIYGSPALKSIGEEVLRDAAQRREKDLRVLPDVKAALQRMSEGGAAEGTARMLCLLAKARGYVRRSRLERQLVAFKNAKAFAKMNEEALARLVHRQSIIVDFEPEQAIATLPLLLDTEAERRDALAVVMEIAGPRETMHPAALVMYQRFESMLNGRPDAASETQVPSTAKAASARAGLGHPNGEESAPSTISEHA
jgi:hypothetical protein